MKANPIEVTSHWGEPDHNDDGDYIGTGFSCEECGEAIPEGQAIIHFADLTLDKHCAEIVGQRILDECKKY